jgi:hypothetical protein
MNVIKVPNTEKRQEEYEKRDNSFQNMPRLYLELLENKDKIKHNLVNQEYDPSDAKSVVGSFFEPIKNVERPTMKEDWTVENRPEDKIEESKTENHLEDSRIEQEEDEDDESSFSEISLEDRNAEEDKMSTIYSSSTSSVQMGKREDIQIENKEQTKQKLKELLSSTETFYTKEEEGKRGNEQEREVPKLSELEKRGEVKTTKHVPTLTDNLHPEEEDELKRELLFKFELLKKSYKDVSIPEFTMYSEYKNMSQTYENLLRQVTMDSNVQSYKSFLIGGFLLFEFVLGVWLKFDMSGFTQQQILNMNQYERLLIELGEKSYVPGGSQWPVEMRLLCMILFNAVVFVISKVILKRTGQDMVNMMNTPFVSPKAPSAEKKKMKGPSIQFDDLNF